jgi:hypothetical protein
MASWQSVVEHYWRVCECAWQQPCATTSPGADRIPPLNKFGTRVPRVQSTYTLSYIEIPSKDRRGVLRSPYTYSSTILR